MALNGASHIDVRVGGSDNNGGGFSTAGNTYATDLTATSGNTSTPTVSSVSYTFVAGDVNDWLYVASGTTWYPGWYQITGVSGGNATVSASASAAPNYNAAAGVASVASPSGGSWSIDRTQKTTVQVAIDNSTITTSVTANVITFSTGYTPTVADVGNWVNMLTGTNVTTGPYQITAVNVGSKTWTVAGGAALPTSGTTTNATGNMGAAFATPGFAAKKMVAGNFIHIKSNGTNNDYTITTTTTGSNGPVTMTGSGSALGGVVGYQTTHWDNGTAPTIQGSGGTLSTSAVTAPTGGAWAINLVVDCNSTTSFIGMTTSGSGTLVYNCTVKNCVGNAFTGGLSNGRLINCLATNSSTGFVAGSSGATYINCVASGCGLGFSATQGATYLRCLAINGSSTGGFLMNIGGNAINCVAYNNAGYGFSMTVSGGTITTAINCLSIINSSYGFYGGASTTTNANLLINCGAYHNLTANYDSALSPVYQTGLLTLSSVPFTNAGSNDFSLTSTAGGGAACKSVGYPSTWPSLSTTEYLDIGAAQSQGAGKTGGFF